MCLKYTKGQTKITLINTFCPPRMLKKFILDSRNLITVRFYLAAGAGGNTHFITVATHRDTLACARVHAVSGRVFQAISGYIRRPIKRVK